MAKKAKAEGEGGGHGVAALKGNGYDPEIVKGFVGRIQNLHADLAREQSAYMTECKVIRGDMKEVYDEAKDAGIPKKELKRVIKRLQLEGKIDDLRDDLEGQEVDNYDHLLNALGKFADTPLGGAALGKTKNGKEAHA